MRIHATHTVPLLFATAFAGAQTPPPKKAVPAAAASTPKTAPAPVRVMPSQEDVATAAAIRVDIKEIAKQLDASVAESEKYTGGLIKARIDSRISVMRYTIAMLDQRARALELGAKIVSIEVQSAGTDPAKVKEIDSEITVANARLEEINQRASKYSGGLILAQLQSTAATVNETIALLEQKRAIAKYGIVTGERRSESEGSTTGSATAANPVSAAKVPAPLKDTIISVKLRSRNYHEQRYEKSIFLSGEFTADGLDKTARSIKGTFRVQDLFGETKVPISWTITQSIAPGQTVSFSGQGIEYNQFKNAHQWLRSTDVNDMKAVFSVEAIIYDDGTRRDF